MKEVLMGERTSSMLPGVPLATRPDGEFSRLGLMGGCGSSGTTLLVHLLSRNADIGSGPEFNAFNHPETYSIQSFRKNWSRLKLGRARAAGYIDVPVFMTHRDHYRIDDALIETWLRRSASSAEFFQQVQLHLRHVLNCHIVLEKSPSNVYTFRLSRFSLAGVRLIHVIRDGRDVAVSLMRRGFNIFGAGSRWLHDTLCGLSARGPSDILEVRYESLVRNPTEVVAMAVAHLGAATIREKPLASTGDSRGLYAEDWKSRPEPRAWNQTPSDPVSDKSVGQYRTVLSSDDLARLYRIRLIDGIETSPGLPRSFGDLMDYLGYGTQPNADSHLHDRPLDRRLELQDYWRRVRRFTNRNQFILPRRYTTITPH